MGRRAYPRSAISVTYCVSRNSESTGLFVFVSLHIAHPAVI